MSDQSAPTEQPTVAVLGTGIMGSAMARNLLAAGLPVRAWNRTRERAEPLAEAGATVCDTPAEAVTGAAVVLTMMLDGPVVEAAVRAAAPGLRPGTLWVQSSTVGPAALPALARLAEEQGLHLVDAPVLGTKAPAEQGALVVLAAGPREVRATADRVFDAVGKRTLWLGEDAAAGAASRLKLVANSWVLSVINATAETLALAEGLGADAADFLAAVEGGPLDSPYLRAKAQAVREADYSPQFPLSGGLKDARLIEQSAQEAGVRLDALPAVAERLARAEAHGHGGEDCVASYFASFED
ncbi:NAD(P)-dependent oxidoreductase [Streptomyces sp. NPDC059740]|uniref:NAD(P)-dependent oxidoreductase n=1 Tax=Streptomyces sp. NPDC059740 TaxID=3346926 RepID=UPI00365C002F